MRSSRKLQLVALLLLASTSILAQSQTHESEIAPTTPSPVAFVYVQSGWTKVYGFTAAANGRLTPAPGSPYAYGESVQRVNGKYLFGVRHDSKTVDSFLMAATGAISRVASTDTSVFNTDECFVLGSIAVDHSGQGLYNTIGVDDCDRASNSAQESFHILSNGHLSYLGTASSDEGFGTVEAFLGSNKLAYGSDYFSFGGSTACGINTYKRLSNNVLNHIGSVDMSAIAPPTSLGFTYYCAFGVAADPTNHIAAVMIQDDGTGTFYGKPQIGVMTADASGNLTSPNTQANMPVIETTDVNDGAYIRMSPSGKLLAAGGPHGLELFHFNGGSPATKYKIILSGHNVGEVYWDMNNHLYAEADGNKLYVYTATPTSVVEAPGSPYTIPNEGSFIIQPR